jgi:hypothetical protein
LLRLDPVGIVSNSHRQFNKVGFPTLPKLFFEREAEVLRAGIEQVFRQESPAKIEEKKSEVVRTARTLRRSYGIRVWSSRKADRRTGALYSASQDPSNGIRTFESAGEKNGHRSEDRWPLAGCARR